MSETRLRAGRLLKFTHGEDTRTWDALAKRTLLLGQRVDYFIRAHKHRVQERVSGDTEDGSAVVVRVPSLCGMDGFAHKLECGGKPGALVMEAGDGRRCVYPFVL